MYYFYGFLIFVGGYAASIYTWPAVRGALSSIETEVRRAEDRLRALRDKARRF